jgi:hypothetical protein
MGGTHVKRTDHRLILVAAMAMATSLLPSLVFAQQSPAPSAVAQQHLTTATEALNSIDMRTVSGDAGKALATVRRDFQEMQSAVTNAPATADADWRTKYSAVERDLTTLIGPMNTQPGQTPAANVLPVDDAARGALQQFRSSLELFYAAMMGQSARPAGADAATEAAATPAAAGSLSTGGVPPTSATTGTSIPNQAAAATPPAPQPAPPTSAQPPAPPPAQPSVDFEGASALLDRMQSIVNATLGNKPAGDSKAVGTTGVLPGVDTRSKAGKISVDRAALDEILAELEQLRTMLRVRR